MWQRGTESAEIVGTGQKLAIAALGGSGATPPTGITAPVVYFADYAALEAAAPGSLAGKIAFIDHKMMRAQDGSSYGTNGAVRRAGPALAQSKGAVAVLIRSLGTDYHRNPHTGSTSTPAGVAPIAVGGTVAARCRIAGAAAGGGAGEREAGFDAEFATPTANRRMCRAKSRASVRRLR